MSASVGRCTSIECSPLCFCRRPGTHTQRLTTTRESERSIPKKFGLLRPKQRGASVMRANKWDDPTPRPVFRYDGRMELARDAQSVRSGALHDDISQVPPSTSFGGFAAVASSHRPIETFVSTGSSLSAMATLEASRRRQAEQEHQRRHEQHDQHGMGLFPETSARDFYDTETESNQSARVIGGHARPTASECSRATDAPGNSFAALATAAAAPAGGGSHALFAGMKSPLQSQDLHGRSHVSGFLGSCGDEDLAAVIPASDELDFVVATAKDAARLQTALADCVSRMGIAARRQLADHRNLHNQHQSAAARLETVWGVAAANRVQTAQLESDLSVHIRTLNAVAGAVNRLQQHAVILDRGRRRSALLAADSLFPKTLRRFLIRHFTRWGKVARRANNAAQLRQRNRLVRMRRGFSRWLLCANLRARLRAIGVVEQRNRMLHRRQVYTRWRQFRRWRRMIRSALGSIVSHGARLLAARNFRRWCALAARRRMLRTRSRGAVTIALGVARLVLAKWFGSWCAHAKARRNRLRMAANLALVVRATYARRTFHDWRRAAAQRRDLRHLIVDMRHRNLRAVVARHWRKWWSFRHECWMERRIAAAIAPINAKIDISLRTASHANDTILRLLEHQAQLERRLTDISHSKVSHAELRTAAFKTMSGGPGMPELDEPAPFVPAFAAGGPSSDRPRQRAVVPGERQQQQFMGAGGAAATGAVPLHMQIARAGSASRSGSTMGAPLGGGGAVHGAEPALFHQQQPQQPTYPTQASLLLLAAAAAAGDDAVADVLPGGHRAARQQR